MLPIIHLDAGGTFMVTFSIVMAQVSTLISTNYKKSDMTAVRNQLPKPAAEARFF